MSGYWCGRKGDGTYFASLYYGKWGTPNFRIVRLSPEKAEQMFKEKNDSLCKRLR